MSNQTLSDLVEFAPLQIRVDSALQQHPHLRGSRIRPLAEGDSIVLRGTVGSYFLKQMAQEAARSVEGADFVDNQITVSW